MNGIICINKPKDWTSFDVVAKFRGIARTKKCGHTGTLDPMATGVLPILLGNATKLSSLIPDSDKGYRAGFQLGVTTDTLDATGTVLSTVPVQVSLPQLEAALASFRGNHSTGAAHVLCRTGKWPTALRFGPQWSNRGAAFSYRYYPSTGFAGLRSQNRAGDIGGILFQRNLYSFLGG